MPNLLAAYAPFSGNAWRSAIEPIVTMSPAARARMSARKARMKRSGATRFVSRAAANEIGSVASTGASVNAPALFTTIVGAPPNSSRMRRIAASTAPPSDTSHTIGIALTPNDSATSWRAEAPRAISATRAPCATSAVAVARPIPRDAPVTTHVTPSSRSAADSAALVLDIVVLGLPEPQAAQRARRHTRREGPPARDDDVFGRRVDVSHELDVDIQVAVVDPVDDLALHDGLERAQVDDVPRAVVDRALDGHLQGIIVPMPVRVVTLPEQRGVFFGGQ